MAFFEYKQHLRVKKLTDLRETRDAATTTDPRIIISSSHTGRDRGEEGKQSGIEKDGEMKLVTDARVDRRRTEMTE